VSTHEHSDTQSTEHSDTTVVSITVEIEAPQDFVWSVLVDYPRYPEWNPYTVRVETTFELGAEIVLYLPDPKKPEETFANREFLRVIDAPHHLRYDTADAFDGLFAYRDQWVEDLGDGRSSYRTTDVFSGELAPLVFQMQQQWVTDGFNAVARALKVRAETLWQEILRA
jgi:uncharacterized protein YndB with AHSA1/START domain